MAKITPVGSSNPIDISTTHTGNGSAGPFAISFEYSLETNIDVTVDGVLKTRTTDYTFTSATQITFTSGNEPANGSVIVFTRNTNLASAFVTFEDASVLTARNLNVQTEQLVHGVQEIIADYVKRDASLTIKDNLVFEGSTDDNNETTLSITNPTADRTITLPDTTGTVVTTGDTGTVTSTMITDGTIVNADINASAAIDGSKLQAASTSNPGSMSSSDKTKLDGIETAATADQTAAEIRTLVESASDSNVFTDADHTKLNNIEASATADQTGAEIKSLYEGESDTNAFTDAEKTKLSGIETGATADQSNAEIKTAYEANSDTNAFTDAEKTKLGNLGSLNALSDVNTSGVADGKILKYDASASEFIIADDGGSGGGGASAFTGLSDTPANFGSAAGKTVKVNAAGNALEFVTVSTDIVDDTTPQLGGNLDVQTNEITTSTSNGNIKLNPNGTGVVEVKGDGSSTDGTIQLNCSQNSHGVKIKSPPHSAGQSYTLTLPSSIVNDGFLKTNSSGNLSFQTINNSTLQFPDGSTGLTLSTQNEIQINSSNHKIVFDTDTSNIHEISFAGPSSLTKTSAFTLPEDGSNGQFLKTDGNGVLSFGNAITSNAGINSLYDEGTRQLLLATNKEVRIKSGVTGESGKFVFRDGNTANMVSFTVASTLSADVDFVLPSADGSSGQFLKTDGSGVLSFADAGGAGATGGGTDQVFFESDQAVTTSYTLTANKNAHTVSPTINSGVTVTVPSGALLVIL